ncbi:cytosolic acyl coenzyme A thioester hydrolase isoform X2 [Sphaerodactylus townsendi]|uniref:cytosolic acyl coenzyme A thioester hydrolase isoform X2 n=1 Tax=Sphaerodactylus townsendi TaxID=933632 RepID=UPI002025C279|nr:cytosolic acyl coenzyme A thioester hydrolase isoform X2 [Sphaerodactylus townsendi]
MRLGDEVDQSRASSKKEAGERSRLRTATENQSQERGACPAREDRPFPIPCWLSILPVAGVFPRLTFPPSPPDMQRAGGSGGTAATMSRTGPGAIQISRIMCPDDANIAGNVHGGTILKMIEEAGAIISTRHCNSQSGERCVAALARVERMDFLSPMCIGDVAHVSAEITYTSKHSVEVQVNVVSENIFTGAKKVTDQATLWYVPLALQNVHKVLEVPPIQYAGTEQEEEGRRRYEEQKLERLETKERNGDVILPVINPDPYTVGYSQSSLIHLVGPSDCTLHGFVHGGVTMKLMDEVAGIVAARHCKTNIVTASVDAINFHEKIKIGSVITVSGRMTFTSNKSMEIEVFVDAEPFVGESQERYRAVSAFVTYVSLNKEGRPQPVPQLVVETEDERRRFEEGKGRYLQTKAKRQAKMKPLTQQ